MPAPAKTGRPLSFDKQLRRLVRQNGAEWLEQIDRQARLGDSAAACWLADRALELLQEERQQQSAS
ncbi:MAG: hypothetical protein K9L82_16980 [Chromatiaceae bacterium]|nr:hypothetical protein [Chromatiaceae bacterium]MCF7993861.1 hypothetical protein [Chromatiaceae bacterium]MCF8017154.1 hypothetical protein [Chromatiaceae bacterium]